MRTAVPGLVAFALAFAAAPVRADIAPPAAGPADALDDGKPKSARVPPTRTNPRVRCGCPQARLLARGPQVLDEDGTVSAWLHDGARLEAFRQDEVNKQKLHPMDDGSGAASGAPLLVEEFAGFGDHMPVATTSRLVRARATGALPAAAYLGVMRKNDPSPRDVLAVSGSGGSASPPPSDAPVLRALWLAPLEERERPGCGTWVTHRLAFEMADGSSPGAGVTDGTGTTDLTRQASPATADAARIAEPFPVPGEVDLRGPSYKEIAMLVMGGGVAGATLFALFTWVIIPARKRRVKDFPCPTCAKAIPIDTLDPKTDGFFCPSCGASGFWKGKGVDVETKPLPKAPPAP